MSSGDWRSFLSRTDQPGARLRGGWPGGKARTARVRGGACVAGSAGARYDWWHRSSCWLVQNNGLQEVQVTVIQANHHHQIEGRRFDHIHYFFDVVGQKMSAFHEQVVMTSDLDPVSTFFFRWYFFLDWRMIIPYIRQLVRSGSKLSLLSAAKQVYLR